MQARLSAFLIWALVAAGVAFWGLRMFARPSALPVHAQVVDTQVIAGGDFARMFGAAPVVESAAPAPVAESSRFKLLGVLAPVGSESGKLHSQGGVALIAVDDKPAKPYAVGAPLDADLILQSVARRSASIGPAGEAPSVVLELPPPTPPATGTLPMAAPESEPMASRPHIPPPPPPQAGDESTEPAPNLPPPRGDTPRNPALR